MVAISTGEPAVGRRVGRGGLRSAHGASHRDRTEKHESDGRSLEEASEESAVERSARNLRRESKQDQAAAAQGPSASWVL